MGNIKFKHYFVVLFLINLLLPSSYADEIAPLLIGYNVAGPIAPQYDTSKFNPADFGLSMSFYKLNSKRNGIRLDHGLAMGFEVNTYTGRVYLGSNWLLLGLMYNEFYYIPLLFGVSTKGLFEISKHNEYSINIGGDIGLWLNLGVLGQVGISGRYMLLNQLSLRIEYGHRIVFFGERSRHKHKNKIFSR